MRVIKVEVFHSLDSLSLGESCIALVLELRLAFAVGIFGIIEDAKELFTLTDYPLVRTLRYMRAMDSRY